MMKRILSILAYVGFPAEHANYKPFNPSQAKANQARLSGNKQTNKQSKTKANDNKTRN